MLFQDLDVASWSWLYTQTDDGMIDLIKRAERTVLHDLAVYAELEDRYVQEKKYGLSGHFHRVANTVRSRSLLGFLASHNVLPKYGFPTDVVELKAGHLEYPEASRVELQRDLRIAIAEYAPGAEVVAAKRIWVGGGLAMQPQKSLPTYHYAICPHCGRFHAVQKEEELDGTCSVCGNPVFGRRHLHGTFIKPEFGFVARRDVDRRPGEARPQRLYASRVYFAEYALPQPKAPGADPPPTVAEVPLRPVHELSSRDIVIEQRYSRFGKLAIVNAGANGRGFLVCSWCGYAELAPESPRPSGRRRSSAGPEGHKNPVTGRDCKGVLPLRHLGHEFLTDVVEIRATGLLAANAEPNLWRSIVYALLQGASLALGIRRDDLDGTLYRYHSSLPPAVMLFDDVPGGAGHVRRVADALPVVFRAAHERLNSECCGVETSCYECLRNFRNQPYHDELRRGLARDFLGAVIAGTR